MAYAYQNGVSHDILYPLVSADPGKSLDTLQHRGPSLQWRG